MKTTDLDGSWEFRKTGETPWLPARVPGSVHEDLLAAKRIPDPFVRLNELDTLWVDEADFEYRKKFQVPSSTLKENSHQLVFEGLDTVAEVFLNGFPLGRTDNMFRRWVFSVGSALHQGSNELRVVFHGAVKEGKRLAAEHGVLPGGDSYGWGNGRSREVHRNQLRKAQYQFGWDWGPCLATAGIWKSVRLLHSSAPRIEDVTVDQEHGEGEVRVKVLVHWRSPVDAAGTLRLSLAGQTLEVPVKVGAGESRSRAEILVKEPKLWWPAGYGDQPLYELKLEAVARGGGATGGQGDGAKGLWDKKNLRIGFRKIELVREKDEAGESFFFKVNGLPIFCKGANWIPADPLPTRVSRETYERLLDAAVEAHMNMIRVWGGGIYENDQFYDLCDEKGLLLWHDHMFACASYPVYESFLKNVDAEVAGNVRRLQHHASIALWCGNNENEGAIADWGAFRQNNKKLREDYQILTQVEARATQREDPGRPWWPSSPSTTGDFDKPNDWNAGDAHFWEVWHGRKPFDRYLEIKPRFNSEFGFQSFPHFETLRKYLDKDDLSINSGAMEHHQRSWGGNMIICETSTRYFRLPQDIDDFFYISQLTQALAIQMGVEHWRRIQPHCMGTLYWQLNDCWPVASWSSVDSDLRWKALHYAAKRFYAPLLASSLERDGKAEIWLSSDLACRGAYGVELWSYAGKKLKTWKGDFDILALGSRQVLSLPVDEILAGIPSPMGRGNEPARRSRQLDLTAKAGEGNAPPDPFDARALVFLRYTARSGKLASEGTLHLAPLKRVDLPKAKILAKPSPQGLLLSTSDPVFSLELRSPLTGHFSDNYFDLMPGEMKRLSFVSEGKAPSAGALKKGLRMRSIRETY